MIAKQTGPEIGWFGLLSNHPKILSARLINTLSVDSVEVIAQLREEGARLIVRDLVMPRMDRSELLDRLRALERSRAVPVVVLDARVLTPDEGQLLRAGSTAVIHKCGHEMERLLDAEAAQLPQTV